MVNPTGYTALDLIGFTDQGTYSSSDNYVKNDLAHYSGNIWRCLIDDTTGIAPAEGVNWTLFIGEPTNLVERIIAPVETDPATNAWTVGRQIIYNDNLYEVIAAITAGDALVAYEDDPTNANIKLADPVETQLLNLKGNVSNRNLLDNAWFTVNQRGQSSYSTSGGYTVDRWRLYGSNISLTVNTDSIILTASETNAFYCEQTFEDALFNNLLGKTLTISALKNNGDIISTSAQLPSTKPSSATNLMSLQDDEIRINLRFDGTHLNFRMIPMVTTPITIKAVKLELGSISTLAMDTAPNYAEELLKCQRYYVRYNFPQWSSSFIGLARTSNNRVMFAIQLPVKMRTIPTLASSGYSNFRIYNPSHNYAIDSMALWGAMNNFQGSFGVHIDTSVGVLVDNEIYQLYQPNDSMEYISFSADL